MSTQNIFLLSLDVDFFFRDRALKAFYECFVTYLYQAIVSKSKCSTQLIVTKLLHNINCGREQPRVRLLRDKMSLKKTRLRVKTSISPQYHEKCHLETGLCSECSGSVTARCEALDVSKN